MTSHDTDEGIEKLASQFVEHQRLEIAAQEREDTRSANLQFDKMYVALKRLSGSQAGRAALEKLMDHEMPEVRLRAAGQVISWAAEKAIPVLGHLLVAWRPKDLQKGYVAVRVEAAGWLYDYFGVKDCDRNKLIEPLRAFGIDLPRRSDQS